MSFPESPHLRRKRLKNPNKIEPDQIAMNTLIAFVTTSKGWIIRQAIKATAYVTTPLTVWLEANGQGESSAAIVSGIVAAVSVVVEIGLSYLARKNP